MDVDGYRAYQLTNVLAAIIEDLGKAETSPTRKRDLERAHILAVQANYTLDCVFNRNCQMDIEWRGGDWETAPTYPDVDEDGFIEHPPAVGWSKPLSEQLPEVREAILKMVRDNDLRRKE